MRAGSDVDRPIEVVVLAVLVAVAMALVGLGMTTSTDETAGRPDWIAQIGAAVAFAIAIVLSAGVVVGIASVGRAVWRSIAEGTGSTACRGTLRSWSSSCPIVTCAIASIGTRRATQDVRGRPRPTGGTAS